MASFDEALLGAGKSIRRGYSFLYDNSGKLIAAIAGVIAIVLTFTEVAMPNVVTAEMTSEIVVLLIASVIIYLSLEDTGERSARAADEYLSAHGEYLKRRDVLRGRSVAELREFCLLYSREELEYRRRTALFEYGITDAEYKSCLAGEAVDKKVRRRAAKIAKMKPLRLEARALLGDEEMRGKSEIRNPEKEKWLRLIIGIAPSILCMLFTVTVMISTKDGMTPSDVIEGIVKLSTLPMIGLKGYSAGYNYVKGPLMLWQRTKCSLIDAFLSGEYVNKSLQNSAA